MSFGKERVTDHLHGLHLRLFKRAKIDGVMDEIHHLLKKGEKSSKLISVGSLSNKVVGLQLLENAEYADLDTKCN